VNIGRATGSRSVATDLAVSYTQVEDSRSRHSLSVDFSLSLDMTRFVDRERAGSHEQPPLSNSSISPDLETAADQDARDGHPGNVKRTEINMSEAIREQSGPSSLPQLFEDVAHGLLPSPSVVCGEER
jgi:hypothetical protein